jgi:hypothetical protein
MLRYQPFQTKFKGLRNRSGPISPCSNRAMKMPSGRRASSGRGWSFASRQLAQVVAIGRQNIKGVKPHLIIVVARVQPVEIRDAIAAEQHGPSITNELDRLFQGRLDDPGIALGPAMAVLGEYSPMSRAQSNRSSKRFSKIDLTQRGYACAAVPVPGA